MACFKFCCPNIMEMDGMSPWETKHPLKGLKFKKCLHKCIHAILCMIPAVSLKFFLKQSEISS